MHFLPRLAHGTQWSSPPLYEFFFIINDFTLLWRQTQHFPAIIKLNWTNPARCIAWRSYAIFPCYTPKLVNVTNYNRKLKWTEEFCILLRILSFEMFTLFVKSKDCSGCEYFSPDLCRRMPGRRIESFEVLPSIQRNPEVQVYFVSFRSFEPRNSASILHSVVIKT